MHRLDLQGKRFGKLLVNRMHEIRNNQSYWECQCDCGNTTIVHGSKLTTGYTKSCGCLRAHHARDIAKQRFGRLVALQPSEKRDSGGRIIWLCQCDCGNHVEVSADGLLRNGVRSCGCLHRDTSRENIQRFAEIEYHDNTCLFVLSNKQTKANTSGRRGVYFDKKTDKWMAYITFQKKRKILGYFSKFEDAVKARERAEEELFEPILNAHGRTLYEKES